MPRGGDGAPVPFPAGKKARRKAARALAARRAVALAMARKAVPASGSFAEEFADIEPVTAHHGYNHEVPDALAHARAHQNAPREYVSELYGGAAAGPRPRPCGAG